MTVAAHGSEERAHSSSVDSSGSIGGTNTTHTRMSYDAVVQHLGEFGPYQRRIYFLLCLPAITCALQKLSGVFLQASPKHRCLLPNERVDAPYELSYNEAKMSLPWDSNTGTWSQCFRLNVNLTEEYIKGGIPANETIPCKSWIYDRSDVENSATTEWNLVCERNWQRPMVDSALMLGVLCGSVIFGAVSDRYGRKQVFFYALVIQVISGFLTVITPEYITFVILRFITGLSSSGAFLVAYVIALEMVGPSKRLLAGVICQMFFSLGYILTAGFAYFIKEWRMLQIALTAPGVFFLLYRWFIPESVRWLLLNGEVEKANIILKKMAKENKVTLPDDLITKLLPSRKKIENQKVNIWMLMKYPNMRKRSLNIFFNWFVNNITYYGLSWNTSNIGGNDYLNFFICGAVEFPAYIFLLLTLNNWGRKPVICGCMLVSGVALILTLAVPLGMTWLNITLYMIGKLAITASYGAVYVFTAEQFPTVIRNAALGSSSMFARFGGILAPFMNLLSSVWLPLPQLIFGVTSVTAGLLALLLPETLNRTLPDTIEEGEQFGRKTRPVTDTGLTLVET